MKSTSPVSSRWYDALPKPDLVAPGHRLVATTAKMGTLAAAHPGNVVTGHAVADDAASYMRLSGTSMAAAVVSGVVAVMIDAHRDGKEDDSDSDLTPNAVKAILLAFQGPRRQSHRRLL